MDDEINEDTIFYKVLLKSIDFKYGCMLLLCIYWIKVYRREKYDAFI